jgi:hypothetical protein
VVSFNYSYVDFKPLCNVVRYHMGEDPKYIKIIKIPSLDSIFVQVYYEKLVMTHDNQFLVISHNRILQW